MMETKRINKIFQSAFLATFAFLLILAAPNISVGQNGGSESDAVVTDFLKIYDTAAGKVAEHLGQLIAYARMNGVAPPWSQ